MVNPDVGDWEEVTVAQTVSRSLVTVENDIVPVGSSAVYRVIVQTEKGTTRPSDPGNNTDPRINSVGPATYNVGWTVSPVSVTADDGLPPATGATGADTSRNAIVFLVATEPGYTYSIYRQPIGETNGIGDEAKSTFDLVPGATFAAVAGTLDTTDADGIYKFQYTPDLQRQKYRYEIRAYKDGALADSTSTTTAARSAVGISSGDINTTVSFGTAPALDVIGTQTRWYYIDATDLTNTVSGQLISGESVYIYGRVNPNLSITPAPSPSLQIEGTTLVGDRAASYYDGSTANPWPTVANGLLSAGETAPPNVRGYWVRGSAYYGSLTAEVK
jgi:hypothetical protein